MSEADEIAELREEYISHLEEENETLRKEVVSVRDELQAKDKELKKLQNESKMNQAAASSIGSSERAIIDAMNRIGVNDGPIDPPSIDMTLRHQAPPKYCESRNGIFTEVTICPDCGIVCRRLDNENRISSGYCKFCGRKGKVQPTLGIWEEEEVETKIVTQKRKWPFGKMNDVEEVETNKVGKWVFKKK